MKCEREREVRGKEGRKERKMTGAGGVCEGNDIKVYA